MKRYWVIKNSKRELIKSDTKILFFDTPDEARNYISIACGNSPYLDIVLWSRKKS